MPFHIDSAVLVLASRLVVTACTTFLAIAVWAKVRDGVWMLLVTGVLAAYADILYNLLIFYGLLPENWPMVAGIPVLPIVLVNLPWLFYCLAFLGMLRRYRSRR